MQKLKLTKVQLEAVNKALDHYNGDADYLLVCHFNLKAYGYKWELWPELNDFTTSQLRAVLIGTYEIVEEADEQPVTNLGGTHVKQFIKIIRSTDLEKQRKQALEYELDYELASLHMAIEQQNEREIARSKQRLAKINEEMGELTYGTHEKN